MANRLKVTITIDEAAIKDIDRLSKRQGESRSRLIEEAIGFWRQNLMERELVEGYKAMYHENAEIAEDHLAAGVEVLK